MMGNICMDHFMVDLTDLPTVEIGDERITAEEIASKINTISIEIVTRLGKRMTILYKE